MLDDVKEIHIEPTSLCNAECPQCPRNINGKGLNPHLSLKSLTLEWFKNNLKTTYIKKIDKIFFCGLVGDPAACPELLDIISYLKEQNPKIIIGINTNGGIKNAPWWSKLGHLLNGKLDYCVFSIDGLEDTNHLYRRNVKWRKVMENAQSYISTGASAHWDMLVFKHNKHQVSEAKELANRMGFNWFRTKETDRWDIYPPLKDLKPASEFIEIEYGSQINCEIKRDKSVYLDYTGKFWPCCHMAEGYLSFIGREMHNDIRKYNNTQLFEEYKTRLENNTPFYVCKRSCGLTTGKKSQWKTETQLK
jgi:MoaA/NifB/PqqE/SkfB family radical SAM enzyme